MPLTTTPTGRHLSAVLDLDRLIRPWSKPDALTRHLGAAAERPRRGAPTTTGVGG